jgi:hypothetical protein
MHSKSKNFSIVNLLTLNITYGYITTHFDISIY